MTTDAAGIARTLGLTPHPEGGQYRETWRADGPGRSGGAAILYLLEKGERSRWHRIDADEMWHFHAGSPLLLRIALVAVGPASRMVLGADIAGGARPQILVPKGAWQSAAPMGGWTLVGCTTVPAFAFEGFDLAPDEFDIPDAP